ncbi:carbohydrate sulfotransferase 15-like [Asterias amurensis]|uniref:carbohydrate sulfotransferase 15-like n=1 Tax=Asterias amurensis TaxID=7602 RepID=UPI003AB451BB
MKRRNYLVAVYIVGSLLLLLEMQFPIKLWPRAHNDLQTTKQLHMSEVTTTKQLHMSEVTTTKQLHMSEVMTNEGSSKTESDSESNNRERKYDSNDGHKTISSRNISKSLYEFASNVFDAVPVTFLPEFKNPCWRSQLSDKGGTSSPLMCLPYFFLAGMPKCGTTDIHTKLHKHPQIVRPAAKEPHWWTRRRFTGMSLRKYLRQINGAKHWKGSDSMMITGDSSAATFFETRGLSEVGPSHVNAEFIHAVLPNSKIIVTFRDPVQRSYSRFRFMGRPAHDSQGPSVFHSQVVQELNLFKLCQATKDNRTCAYRPDTGKTKRGCYSIFLRDWLNFYPRDQIKVIRMEDWQTNCTQILPQLFEFLQLRKLDSAVIEQACRRKVNVNRRKHKPMLPETMRLLKEFYRPFNVELALMLNDDKYLW